MQLARPITRGPSPWLSNLCFAASVAMLLAMLYHPVLSAGYILPEDQRVAERAQRDDWLACNQCRYFVFRLIGPMPDSASMPLARISHVVDLHLARGALHRAFQSHLGNLALHFCNVVLLFSILRRFSVGLWISALCALVFAVHPVQVAAIASAAQRGLLLGMVFSLLVVAAHIRVARGGHWLWRGALVLLFGAAFISHPAFIGLPIFLLMLDVWPLRRFSPRAVREKMLILLMMLIRIVVTLAGYASADTSFASLDLETLATHLTAMWVHIFLPWSLSPFYPQAAVPSSAVIIAASLVYAGLLVWSAFRWKSLFVGLGGILILTVPSLWLAPSEGLLSDAWLYTGLLAPIIVAAVSLGGRLVRADRSTARIAVIACTSLVLALTVQTYAYAMHWNNTRDVYLYALRKYPSWAGGFVGLVEASIAEYDLDSALRYAEKAVESQPNQPATQFYLGTVLLLHQDGRAGHAIAPLRRALQARPNWGECLQNLGVALARSGKHEQALGYLEKARDLLPASPALRVALGNVYLQLARPASARAEFQEALKDRCDWVVNLGLAMAWAANDMPMIAQRHLAVAVAKDPSSAALAARWPALRRYQGTPGFDSLIAADAGSAQISENTSFPAASSAATPKDSPR